MTPIDIIIVNYNSTEHLITCLTSIRGNSPRCRPIIHVEDNGSTDNPGRIPRLFPEIRFHRNKQNLGFARAVNQALGTGGAEYVMLLNPDTILSPGFIDSALDFMESHPDAGIMGPKILDMDGRLQNSARSFPTLLTAFFGRSSFLSKRFPRNPITSRNLVSLKSDGKTPMTVDWVSGACMIVRRRAVRKAGFLDERFFMYWEDTDWCRRMNEAGWRVIYYPRISITHYVGGSSQTSALRSVIEFHKSVYYLFEKYVSPGCSWLTPLVFGGLAARLAGVLLTHFFKHTLRRSPSPLKVSPPEPPKTRILRIISRLNIGGPSIHVYLLSKGLNPDRFRSRLVAGAISPEEGSMGYLFSPDDPDLIFLPQLQREIRPVRDLSAIGGLLRIIRSEKPDIVHTHTAKAGFAARLAVRLHAIFTRRPIAVVHTFHGHVFEGYFSPLASMIFILIERFLGKFTDIILTISETQRNEIIFRFRIADPGKVRMIPLGFDLSPFLTASSFRGEFRKRLGVAEDVLLIGMIGRLAPIKNHRMFIQAASRCLKKNPAAKVLFVIVGDGELRNRLEGWCREAGATRHFRFCGWIRDIWRVYADLDILALTSRNEGTPVSIIESMAAGVPVIATDAGGVRDLVGYPGAPVQPGTFHIGERGILCRKEDPEGFAAGLAYLIQEDPDERARRIRSARGFVRKRFSMDRLLKEMEDLYDRLTAENHPNP